MFAKVICVACLILVASSAAFAQAAGPRIDLSLIVTDKTNKALSTFRKEDVRVFEDKVEQTIVSIEPDQRSVDFALVIDSSGSVRSLLPSVIEAAGNIILQRRPGDEIFIETFVASDNIKVLHEFSSNGRTLIDALSQIRVEGGRSAILDAVHLGANHLVEHNRVPIRRRALVLVTDGEDRGSTYKLNDVLKQLRAQDVQVFVIGLVTELDKDAGIYADSRSKAEKLLNTLAEESGGLVFLPRNEKELINAAEQIGNALRAQFRLTYQSSREFTKAEFRKVEVKLTSTNGEKLKASAPRGYDVEEKSVNQKPTEPKSP
jgi:VWFA-related protein